MGIYDGILIAENYIDILSKEVTPLYAAMSGVMDDGVRLSPCCYTGIVVLGRIRNLSFRVGLRFSRSGFN